MKKETSEWISGIEDVKKLKPWKDNPRDITNAGFEKLKDRIRQRGFHSSIVVDIDNTILSGNMRWRALNALGIKKVNILRPNRKLTGEERKKIALEKAEIEKKRLEKIEKDKIEAERVKQ